MLLVGATGLANGGPLEDSQAAYDRADYAMALRLLEPLAKQGNSIAQDMLGIMYRNGHGVPQNNAEAAKLFRLAADQGDADAQLRLGLMYEQGQGVPQNYAEAAKWFLLAANQGEAIAQSMLGLMYEQGQGVPQNYAMAHMWFNLASAAGEQLGSKNRDIIASKMTASQIAEAQRLAADWKPKGLSRSLLKLP